LPRGAPKEIIMKRVIFIALAALALAVFAVPDAYGDAGLDVDQTLSGGVHIANVDADGNSTSLFFVLAKGTPGRADVTARLFWGPLQPWPWIPGDERCPAGTGLAADVISFEFVETYADGSLLTGSAAGHLLCLSADGSLTTEIAGSIDGGTGRFEAASGTWQATASSPPQNQSVTGTFTADLN
jgi:hypothetical protein